ncbi:MAG: hypothetical protein IJ545_04745 [Alphaproteobacteria bacterium]|nr:hypothetical protein [Alphaproteobacteria bacterium]
MSIKSAYIKIAKFQGVQAANNWLASLTGQGGSSSDDKKKQEEEQKAVANASAITDSGKTTDTVNSTSEKPAENKEETPENLNKYVADNTTNIPANASNDVGMYINDLRNRRKKRGAPMSENSSTLGTSSILGG